MAGDALRWLAESIGAYQTAIGVPIGSWGVIPQLTVADAPAYAMIGAAATLASVFRAPLTASLLLFELTRRCPRRPSSLRPCFLASLLPLPFHPFHTLHPSGTFHPS